MKTIAQTAAAVHAKISPSGAWSHDLPVVLDDGGNIKAMCVATAIASVPGANPGIWRRLENFFGVMPGLMPIANKDPDMTQEKMCAAFKKVEADALAEGV